MGIYDQFLGLTQHGLDTGTDIALKQASLPTMADVFMDRFRQAGADRMARQKMAEERLADDARMKSEAIQRQIQAMTGAAQYSTPETSASWEELQRSAGINTPLVGQGLKERGMDAAATNLQARLEAELQKIREKAKADAEAALTTGKNLSTFGKVEREKRLGLLPVDRHEGAVRRIEALPPDPVRTAFAVQGLRPEGGGGIPSKVVPIEGGKADVERGVKTAEAKAAFGSASRDVTDMVSKIDELLKRPGLDKATGISGKMLRMVPASEAAVAAGLLASIKAQAGLQKISDLKKSGAGLGQVTEGEHTLVQNAANSLDLDTMDAKTLRANLKELKRKAMRLDKALLSDMAGKTEALGSGRQSTGRVGKATSMADGTYSDGKTTVVVKGGKIVSEQ